MVLHIKPKSKYCVKLFYRNITSKALYIIRAEIVTPLNKKLRKC